MISKRKLPVNLLLSHRSIFEHELVKEIPDHKVIHTHHSLITPDGVVLSDRRVKSESLYSNRHRHFFDDFYRLYYLLRGSILRYKNGPYLLAFDAWSFGYFHWMTEFIPRLFMVRHFIAESTVILPSINNTIWNRSSAIKSLYKGGNPIQNTGYFKESLQVFDLNLTYTHAARNPLKVNDLYVSSHLAPSGNYNDTVMRDLRDFYYKGFGIKEQKPFRLVYASRMLANRRHVENESHLVNLLQSQGFDIIILETLSFLEQLILLSETRFLIAQHGAALTNLLFMKEGTYVLELRTLGDSQNHCYFSLASAMNVNYMYQFCSSDGRSVQDADIVVDLALLNENINLVVDQ